MLNGISTFCGLFNAKVILVEEQRWYVYQTYIGLRRSCGVRALNFKLFYFLELFRSMFIGLLLLFYFYFLFYKNLFLKKSNRPRAALGLARVEKRRNNPRQYGTKKLLAIICRELLLAPSVRIRGQNCKSKKLP